MRQAAGSLQLRQRPCEHHGGLDRADARHQGRDPGAQMRAIFGIRSHHVEHARGADGLRLDRHPSIPSRPRITIIVAVIEAISLAGPSGEME